MKRFLNLSRNEVCIIFRNMWHAHVPTPTRQVPHKKRTETAAVAPGGSKRLRPFSRCFLLARYDSLLSSCIG